MSHPSFGPESPLTPSELVYLNGEQFAQKARFNSVKLLHTDINVSESQLGQAVFAAAFLANERLGALHLEICQKKAMLGLRKVDSLYAFPGTQAAEWPEDTLEADLLKLINMNRGDMERHEISKLIYIWLGQDSSSAWQKAIEQIKAGLAARDLLEKCDEKKLKIFTVTRYAVPERTATLARQLPVQQIRQLLESCEHSRPAVWKLLVQHIKKAIDARTERPDTDMDFD